LDTNFNLVFFYELESSFSIFFLFWAYG
jgi:hypothetical protein